MGQEEERLGLKLITLYKTVKRFPGAYRRRQKARIFV